jgi:hypothetical protein
MGSLVHTLDPCSLADEVAVARFEHHFAATVPDCHPLTCHTQLTAELGKATGDAVLEGWGQLLLANEVTAARKYSQAYTGNDIYRQVRVLWQGAGLRKGFSGRVARVWRRVLPHCCMRVQPGICRQRHL